MKPGWLLLAALAALVLAGAASAEMPANRERPTITGPGVVGEVLLGNNGTWLYADGERCGFECTFSFRWERCSESGCRTVSNQRGYRPRLADLHRELRVEVTATKYDCGEWNYAAGTQECRFDGRTAYSEPVVVAARGRVAARLVAWPARLRIERALVRRGVLRVTVADTLGRLVRGATVIVGTRVRRTNADGAAVFAVSRTPSQVTARAGRQSARVRLSRS
jgi:antitoxin (DNA-binding transcriptional repressor) of toxin-antitoxin stability system